MNDVINRQSAIEAICKACLMTEDYHKCDGFPETSTWCEELVALRAVPSAQPEADEVARDMATIIENEKDMRVIQKNAEYQWIPCSKQMPEEYEWIGTKEFGTTISDMVHVTFENENGERFVRQIMFQNGKLSRVDQRTIDILYKGSKPIAWCPYPKPWEGDNNG